MIGMLIRTDDEKLALEIQRLVHKKERENVFNNATKIQFLDEFTK